MKKKFCIILVSIIAVLCLAFGFSACTAKVEFKVSFVVDGQTVYVINTNGNEIISMPSDPQKDDYIFDGWYWDKEVWEKPFTENSLLDAPLSSNMSVYCKWRPEHEHAYTEEVAEDKYKASGASCTQKAKYYYSCECGEKGTETFEYGELLQHTEETVAGKAATCMEDGLTNGKRCFVCHTVIVEQKVIPAGHIPTAWITDKNSTCTEKGSRHKECVVCGSTLTTEEIELAPHTETTIYGKLPTCTETGWETYKTCSRCDYTTYTELPVTEHSYEEGICSSCGKQDPTFVYLSFALKVDDTYEVKCTATSIKEAVIPALYENKPVTSIGEYAFLNCKSLTNISIPDSVTVIGNYAFCGCASITGIAIPDGVTSTGNYAFLNCKSLTNISIPDSVTSIGEGAFWNCTSLASIIIPDGITLISDEMFNGCTSLTSITIPDGVTYIGDFAFRDCTSLASIIIPDGVTYIGYYAFWNCTSLASIIIPDSVAYIASEAFKGCLLLTIYCEAETKPSGWELEWNISNCPVTWGYKGVE